MWVSKLSDDCHSQLYRCPSCAEMSRDELTHQARPIQWVSEQKKILSSCQETTFRGCLLYGNRKIELNHSLARNPPMIFQCHVGDWANDSPSHLFSPLKRATLTHTEGHWSVATCSFCSMESTELVPTSGSLFSLLVLPEWYPLKLSTAGFLS